MEISEYQLDRLYREIEQLKDHIDRLARELDYVKLTCSCKEKQYAYRG